ncbi:MAG: lauroyl acyltransferase, partial [Alphaproteobacteria bacterium]|nr:lauroyl acyltransferase [Alphaproteobacteria bacterium]
MWDNLVRTFVEYPHLRWLCDHYDDRIEFVNFERIEALRDDDKAGMIFSAHIGNWEIGSISTIK